MVFFKYIAFVKIVEFIPFVIFKTTNFMVIHKSKIYLTF